MQSQNLHFDYGSLRAKKARFARTLKQGPVGVIAVLCIAVAILAGAGLAFVNLSLGLIVASCAAWPAMLLLWQALELNNLQPGGRDSSDIGQIMTGDILGALPNKPTPKQLAQAVMQVSGGQFFAARYGIGPNFLSELLSDHVEDTPAVWATAGQLQQRFGVTAITAATLTAALVLQIPNRVQLLAQLQLDEDDVVLGAAWFDHIKALIAEHARRRDDGGIGRDWSFGYTPLLKHFALDISDGANDRLTRFIDAQQEVLDQIVKQLSGGGRQNAVLVGPTGVGKTTLIYAMASRFINPDHSLPKSLRYRQVWALDPASLIAQARGRGELEDLMSRLFVEAYKAKNIVLFLDEAQLFLQDGTGSVDLSNLLMQAIEGGGLRMVLSMDQQWWLRLSQINPSLVQYLNRISVPPLGEDDTILVLQDQLLLLEHRSKVTYMHQALKEAYRLGLRYVQDQAMPGQAVSVLEAAAQFDTDGLVTVQSVQRAIEKTYGIKVGGASGAEEKSKLLNLEDLIHERMINQVRAVNVVASALRRARAGVRNQERPIGTFLFLGPTGVGKTELAKSLAAVYFGGEDHLVRLDLNEFGQPQDVSRLIADGAQDPNSLTAQISKQPFSVVLLDEIEKAHPNVLNTLLQLLDEGILRDINNKPVSFKDAIIIATSNAGADRIRQYIDAGWQLEQFEEKFVNELIESGQFRPEFLNRFDETVLFRPLKQEELAQLIDLILKGTNKTLASQKITVQVADDAKQLLVQAGYDPRLGARPMRRAVQRSVEDIVAKKMLSGEAAPGSIIEVTAADIQGALER